MNNKCELCNQEFNKDYEIKCPTCGTEEIKQEANFSSFTMDYKTNEILLTVYSKGSQLQTRLTERDVDSMKNWFGLAKHMQS
ncbi:hypothetical protein [Cytobacillus gottheilii]|uniref:Uncharacterized protein n=1 Tax=Cytobacillus gottheilii TaxID=859144 RepID=A0ABX8F955_9BACI|nr:hypothetical protein [Cytobacillus gottheilii]QVY60948.1 hypothetical protein J1899_18555 [Cytobacillus gottheilii]